jgi:hypothetical protein
MAIDIQLAGKYELEESLLLRLAFEEMDCQFHVFKTQNYLVHRHVFLYLT